MVNAVRSPLKMLAKLLSVISGGKKKKSFSLTANSLNGKSVGSIVEITAFGFRGYQDVYADIFFQCSQ